MPATGQPHQPSPPAPCGGTIELTSLNRRTGSWRCAICLHPAPHRAPLELGLCPHCGHHSIVLSAEPDEAPDVPCSPEVLGLLSALGVLLVLLLLAWVLLVAAQGSP